MYKKLMEMINEHGLDRFVMAICHLMDIGWREANKITDEDIEAIKMPDNSIMTTEFVQELNSMAREIAKSCQPSDIIKFCELEKPFDTRGFKKS